MTPRALLLWSTLSVSFPSIALAQPHARATHGTRHVPPTPPPCHGPTVHVHRMDDHGDYVGPLTDCHDRPTVHALAALSALAAPGRDGPELPDLPPIERAISRIAPAVGWDLADLHLTAGPCPVGEEPSPVRVARAPTRAAHVRPASHHRPAHRVECHAIEIPRDEHTHDPMLVLPDQIRILHPRLLAMLEQVAEHFPGHEIEIVSGYRPSSNPRAGSRHAHARALDFHVRGISREALRDFARTLPNAGVGYYPNSPFVHLDVRDPDEGSARWTDYSSHGETPRYGHWPPRDQDVLREVQFAMHEAEQALEPLRNEESAHDPDDASDPPTSSAAP